LFGSGDPDNVDALVTELNAGLPRATPSHDETARLRSWLEHVVERGASDLLLIAGAPPSLRVDGVITPLLEAPLGSEEIADAVLLILPPHARKMYRVAGIADASFRTPDLGRFRINLHHERGRPAAAIRRLPSMVPRLASLGLPGGVEALSRLPRGLVLVGGPTGSGKSTTLAARARNQRSRRAPHHHHRGSDRLRASAPALSSNRWKSASMRPIFRRRSVPRSGRRPT